MSTSKQKFLAIMFVCGLLLFGVNSVAASNCPLPDPDGLIEASLRYQSGPYILDTLLHQPYPFCSFAVQVDGEGSGHLQSYVDPHRAGQMPVMKNSIILDWAERTSYLTEEKRQTRLSLESAKKLWGEPRKYVVDDHPFYVFDAYSTCIGEKNLYHLDLGFTKNGIIMAYRVRGIGISKPRWVVDPHEPWVPEHIKRNGVYE